jgi:hypothetical protein
MNFLRWLSLALLTVTALAEPLSYSGIYPHLVLSNRENECGTGAVVPWADRLWVITYAPHQPKGSSDSLYEITPSLEKIVRPESIGGTPANRMIHEESGQLFIGPYIIDAQRDVRVIPYERMYGRHTGFARHLTHPAEKILYATMEEGIYEVDVKTLAVKPLWLDEQLKVENFPGVAPTKLPGYHGKGFYSAQGRYVYSNNGEHGDDAQKNPRTPSGVLAEWDGKAKRWNIVRRNQFTEVTGPGGIRGHTEDPAAPLWALGWDHKSVLLLCLHEGKWHTYRLPKGSHSYDGAHGWNTEWPRIRDVSADGKGSLLMTMHGTFWNFPRSFSPTASSGISPRSNYLKVVGDFARWQDRIVLGCDDTAKSEFLNKRKAKGHLPAPRSQSNLWFVADSTLDQLGSAIGRGAVWLAENTKAGGASDAYLFSGYETRGIHLAHGNSSAVDFVFEVDLQGNGQWSELTRVTAAPGIETFHRFPDAQKAAWIRVKTTVDCQKATAAFTYHNPARRAELETFRSLASADSTQSARGTLVARDDDALTLAYAATDAQGKEIGTYHISADMKLTRVDDPDLFATTQKETALPKNVFSVDASSALIIDEKGRRWRFPIGSADAGRFTDHRVAREVATERDLLNLAGIFYELPAENAGGYAMARPISTHNRRIHDFCSWRGLLIMSGVDLSKGNDPHLLRSADGKVGLWAGAIDDLWKFGAPHGTGGPWHKQAVKAGETSDPYLMTGFQQKSLMLQATKPTTITVEVDISGYGDWVVMERIALQAEQTHQHPLPEGFSAYWVRFTTSAATTATATLEYN